MNLAFLCFRTAVLILTGHESFELPLAIGSLITYAGFTTFVVIVFLAKPLPASSFLRRAIERQFEMRPQESPAKT